MKIVAELSASHDGSLRKALRLIEEAAFCGADALKIQTFEPELLVGNPHYTIDSGPWAGSTLIDLYRKAHTPKAWHKELFQHAKDLHLEAFSTPFHQSDVDFLETLDCPMYKIASFEIINTDLIEYAASTGKPLILSTGMASWEEILDACRAVLVGGGGDLTLLHCVSQYPTDLEKVNLKSMDRLKELTDQVGISDHSQSALVPIAATARGACLIEKHLCLDRDGLDKFALLPHQFREMVEQVRLTEALIGREQFGVKAHEQDSLKLRPSLYWAQDLPEGTTIEEHHLKVARPAEGASPFYRYQLVGKRLNYNVRAGTPVVHIQ